MVGRYLNHWASEVAVVACTVCHLPQLCCVSVNSRDERPSVWV